MNDLFNCVQFTIAAASYKTPVLTKEVLQHIDYSAAPCIIQKEIKGKKANAVGGTIKAAIVKDDPQAQNIIFPCYFDQKPFYMISNVANKVGWSTFKKNAYSTNSCRKISFCFLQAII